MRYTPLDKEVFINNRSRLRKLLPKNSMAVLNANDVMPTNADGNMRFRTNNDQYYLSGVDQEDSILVIAPDFPDERLREVLFLKETNDEIAIWEGAKLTKEQATQRSGVRTVKWLGEFEKTFRTMMMETETIFLNTNEHIRAVTTVETRDARFIKETRQQYPLHHYRRIAPLMHDLRAVKSAAELKMMERACDITEKGFRRVLKYVKPGVKEYEVEAEYLHEFIRHGSRGFAYDPIIAGGFNACVLHYTDNSMELKDGDLMLMDVGAEYGNYNADMSRTIPVNGRFTQRQRQVYDAVLRVMKEAMELLTPGNNIPDYHREVGKLMERELLGLKLLDTTDVRTQNPDWPAYKKYFMHGTSHHIGLDVHDVGNVYKEIKPGMVFTVEPGIYIREENIGIRLENDIVVRENGYTDLMANIPLEAEEIEEVMNSRP
ncbi:MAG: aminopeptidase P family protein [Cyclobacteriaceae bacterium]